MSNIFPRKDILVIEDSLLYQRELLKVLEPLGLSIDVVNNERDAIFKLSFNGYDVVITDRFMSGTVLGHKAIEFMRKYLEFNSNALVISYSSTQNDEYFQSCQKLGIEHLLPKPLGREGRKKLVEILVDYLGGDKKILR